MFRSTAPGRHIGHVELTLGPATIMLSNPFPDFGIIAPDRGGSGGACVDLQVAHADAIVAHAVETGARLVRAVADRFYGERSGAARQPFGHKWMIGHAIEPATPDEMQRRQDAMAEAEEGAP